MTCTCQTPTVPQRLLAVAATLAGAFTLEDLAVAAWQADPSQWGLCGFEDDYPDKNKVSVALYHRRGLLKRGWLRRCGPRRFEVARTEESVRLELAKLHSGTRGRRGRGRKEVA